MRFLIVALILLTASDAFGTKIRGHQIEDGVISRAKMAAGITNSFFANDAGYITAATQTAVTYTNYLKNGDAISSLANDIGYIINATPTAVTYTNYLKDGDNISSLANDVGYIINATPTAVTYTGYTKAVTYTGYTKAVTYTGYTKEVTYSGNMTPDWITMTYAKATSLTADNAYVSGDLTAIGPVDLDGGADVSGGLNVDYNTMTHLTIDAPGGNDPNFEMQGDGEQTFRFYNQSASGRTRVSWKMANRNNVDWEWIMYTDVGGSGDDSFTLRNRSEYAIYVDPGVGIALGDNYIYPNYWLSVYGGGYFDGILRSDALTTEYATATRLIFGNSARMYNDSGTGIDTIDVTGNLNIIASNTVAINAPLWALQNTLITGGLTTTFLESRDFDHDFDWHENVSIANDADGIHHRLYRYAPEGTSYIDAFINQYKRAYLDAVNCSLQIDSDGTTYIAGTSGIVFDDDTSAENLLPRADSTWDLGTTALRWDEMFLDDLEITNNIAIGEAVQAYYSLDIDKTYYPAAGQATRGIQVDHNVSPSAASTTSHYGVGGYVTVKSLNWGAGSSVGGLNFGPYYGFFDTNGSVNLESIGVNTFGHFGYSTTNLKRAIGLKVIGADGGPINLTIAEFSAGLWIREDYSYGAGSNPLQYGAYIEQPLLATKNYQLALEGTGDSSGVFFGAPSIGTAIDTESYGRIYQNDDKEVCLASFIGGSEESHVRVRDGVTLTGGVTLTNGTFHIYNGEGGGPWDFILIPVGRVKASGVNSPTEGQISDTYSMMFTDQGNPGKEEQVFYDFVLKKSYKSGSDIWGSLNLQCEDDSAGDHCWVASVSYAGNDEYWTEPVTMSQCFSCAEASNYRQQGVMGYADGDNLKPQTAVRGYIRRNSSNVLDTYNGGVYFWSLLVDFEVNKIGSNSRDCQN